MATRFVPRKGRGYVGELYVASELEDGAWFGPALDTGETLTGTPVFTPEGVGVEVVAGTPGIVTYQETDDSASAIIRALVKGTHKIWISCATSNNQLLVTYIEWAVKDSPL